MTCDQWFDLWIAIVSGVFGGLTTIGGAFLGYWIARREARTDRWHDEISHWINVLSQIHKGIFEAAPQSQQEAYNALTDACKTLLHEHTARPTPRGSVGDAIMTPIFFRYGAAAGVIPKNEWPFPVNLPPDADKAPQNANCFASLEFLDETVLSALKLATKWADRGVTRKEARRAAETRIGAVIEGTGGFYSRVSEETKEGPMSKSGGW
ncbi:Uncharacterised protein [Mycobacteroides abscessus subsp. abscessus]|uniref:hypothetical protein n=1 Tax=Mycobacteroides abscessus TaxID=36809 RepID=UPI000926C249|nr:hypothetical protein [Mycobacteroides abscessus]SIM07899.1 Uncharacterised protein [Mycobacteroides abscessus subsp. abscessus]